jgi:hypothetical protein
MPIPAIILICIGCALIIAGLVYVGIMIWRLIKAARKAGIDSMTDVQIVVRKVQGLEPRLRRLEQNQVAITDSLQKLSLETGAIGYLKEELDKATGHIGSLKK